MASKAKYISPEMVRDLLDYDCESGIFKFKRRDIKYCTNKAYMDRFNRNTAGTIAGSIKPNGSGNHYIHITLLDSVRYLAHRVAWVWVTGEQPIEIDHKNGDGTDNRFQNLRSVTKSGNQRNQKKRCDNTSGETGVSYVKKDKTWKANIGTGRKGESLSKTFKNKSDAISWRRKMSEKLNYSTNHGRVNNGI